MTLNLSIPTNTQELRPKITVFGVGGAGGNAVNNMIAAQLEGVEFLVANTDGQALIGSAASRRIQLGRERTEGLGAGSKPEIGRLAAEESLEEIIAELADSHMVFITAGMGGGTGTGAAPVIAKAARERGILTVGVITKPFDFEGPVRMRQAEAGIEELQAYVDTLIIIPNQNLFRLANEKTTMADAFAMADNVLHKGVCGVTDLMVKPGNINLDFADIRAVMSEMGKAMMGTGEASGENRATNAAEAAINNPLLDDTTMKGAQAVLINITGSNDMTLFEVDEAANYIRREVDTEAVIIFGSTLDEKMDGVMRVSVVATGMEAAAIGQRPPLDEDAIQRPPAPSIQLNKANSLSSMDMGASMDSAANAAAANVAAANVAATSEHSVMAEKHSASEAVAEDHSASETAAEEHSEGEEAMTQTDLVAQVKAVIANDAAISETAAEATVEATAEPKAFTMRATVDIPEESPEENKGEDKAEGTKSLMGHLTKMMFTNKPVAVQSTEPEITPLVPPQMTQPEMTAPEKMGTDEGTQSGAAKESDMIKPLRLNPQPQQHPQLDITEASPTEDLDIPAFLRRQAN